MFRASSSPERLTRNALAIGTTPGVREAALDRLRGMLRFLRTPQDSFRALDHTRSERARLGSAAVREILATIGDALLERGAVREGLDSLVLATALVRRVARTALRVGRRAWRCRCWHAS